MSKYIQRLNSWFFAFVVFFLPIFLFVFPGNLYPALRLFVIVILISLAFVLWEMKNFISRGVLFVKGGYILPFFLFLGIIIVSTILITSPGGMNDAFFGAAGMFIFLGVLFFVLIQIGDDKSVVFSRRGFSLAVFVLSVLSVISFVPFLSSLIPSQIFVPGVLLGGEKIYYLLAFFLISIVAVLVQLVKKSDRMFNLLGIFSATLGFGVVILTFLKVGNTAVFLPFSAGWSMTIEIFKNFRFLLAGIGFNQFGLYSPLLRTPELNTDKYIFLQFPQTSNGFFELLNSVGILGFIFFVFLFFRVYQGMKFYFDKKMSSSFDLQKISSGVVFVFPLIFVLISLLLLPFSSVMIFLMFFFLSMVLIGFKEEKVLDYEESKLQLVSPGSDSFLSFQTGGMLEKTLAAQKIFAVFLSILVIVVFYFQVAYPVLSELHFARYLQAVSENKGRSAYEEMNAASSANRRNDNYLAELSRINFQLALSLNGKEGVADDDRQNIAILVNQSISAAQAATQVNSFKYSNWENLGILYQSLIPTDATNSARLGASAFIQAVNLNPQDPVLRLKFAQMLYAAGAYTDAIGQLNSALAIKSDFANAYYNLALNYKQLAQIDNAKKALEMAKKFVAKGSQDEKVLDQELEAVMNGEEMSQSMEGEGMKKKEETQKLSEPQESPKLENLKQELLQIQPATGSATPTP